DYSCQVWDSSSYHWVF
nr:immunoglobulin light chain junction region [Macaca mulatta]